MNAERGGWIQAVVAGLLIVAAFMGGQKFGPVKTEVVTIDRPVDRIVEKPVTDKKGVNELWDRLRAEQKEKDRLAAELQEMEAKLRQAELDKQAALAAVTPKRTTAHKWPPLNTAWPPDSSAATCTYCNEDMLISGEKGGNTVRCFECGGDIIAQNAIVRWKRKYP